MRQKKEITLHTVGKVGKRPGRRRRPGDTCLVERAPEVPYGAQYTVLYPYSVHATVRREGATLSDVGVSATGSEFLLWFVAAGLHVDLAADWLAADPQLQQRERLFDDRHAMRSLWARV